MKHISLRWAVAIVLVVALTQGCTSHTPLPVTPYVLTDGSRAKALEQLPPALQTTSMEILYVSDREPQGPPSSPNYGYARSRGVGYGTATVSIRPDIDWKTLVRDSGMLINSEDYWMEVTKVTEQGRFAPLLTMMEVGLKGLQFSPSGLTKWQEEHRSATERLSKRLAQTPDKDVYLYVHGFNNSFYDAVIRLAGVWHYLGRQGVPIAYTWPAGHGGIFGYFYDRESGESTVYRLKETIRLIADCPDVQRLHIIAHSRGTDVTSAALRELSIEARAKGQDPQQSLKLETLVLAAPDIDSEVFFQRFLIENLVASAHRTVIYTSQSDSALGWATRLFRAGSRVGRIDPDKLPETGKKFLKEMPSLELVECDTSAFATSHAYAFSNPSALSDMILVLRDRKDPGAANGRPLTPQGAAWFMDDNYFKPKKN